MRVLLLGASGFIGREILASLQSRGQQVVPAVRASRRMPGIAGEPPIVVDLVRDTSLEAWLPRLDGVDAVINCAGVLQESDAAVNAIHHLAPAALFDACVRAGVRRVVHISAISATPEAGTAYSLTKLRAEEHLRESALDWTILRPSLVHGRGAYGGTAALRAFAAFPFAIPIPGDGNQRFQPIAMEDLCELVAMALESDRLVHRTIEPVGRDVVSLREMLQDYRRWLGLPAVPVVAIPRWAVRIAVAFADRFGGTLNSTALKQLEHGNTGDLEALAAATGLRPAGWRESLAKYPPHAQDLWHARMYLVRPILRVTLVAVWWISGFAGLVAVREWAPLLARDAGIHVVAAGLLLIDCCLADILIGVLIARRWRPRSLAAIQVALIAAYTAVASLLWPSLWAEALAPLAKNLPIAAAALALGAVEEER